MAKNWRENNNWQSTKIEEKSMSFTNVASREADAALMWRLGCFKAVGQSRARANVPIDLEGDGLVRATESRKGGKGNPTERQLNIVRSVSPSIHHWHPRWVLLSIEDQLDDERKIRVSSSLSFSPVRARALLVLLLSLTPSVTIGWMFASAWYLPPTRISPRSAFNVFWLGS